ncbi:MAG: hypothetical protein V4517_24325 [Pseudomonadota bacterium]
MTSTVAGISRTVRPSRLALGATALLFRGDAVTAVPVMADGAATTDATGIVGRTLAPAARWARVVAGFVRRSGGSLTTIGPSSPGTRAIGAEVWAETGGAAPIDRPTSKPTGGADDSSHRVMLVRRIPAAIATPGGKDLLVLGIKVAPCNVIT